MNVSAQILDITEHMLFDDAIREAQQRQMHLISDGRKVVISPVVPKGFIKVGVAVKNRSTARIYPATVAQ